MVALHVCQVWWTLTYKPLRSMRAHIIVLKTNRLGQVLFPFARWQDDHAETALCIRRTRTRTLCIRRTLCRHVTIGTPIVIFLLFDCFWLFLTIGTLLLHCWYSLDRPVTIGTPMVLSVFDDWYSVPFVNKNLAIANISRVSCAHNTLRASIGINITPWPWNLG